MSGSSSWPKTGSKIPALFTLILSPLAAIVFLPGCATKETHTLAIPSRASLVEKSDEAHKRLGAIPGSFPSAGEELWIVARSIGDHGPRAGEDVPGSGALMAKPRGAEPEVPLPLRHTEVKASVNGYIATVE